MSQLEIFARELDAQRRQLQQLAAKNRAEIDPRAGRQLCCPCTFVLAVFNPETGMVRGGKDRDVAYTFHPSGGFALTCKRCKAPVVFDENAERLGMRDLVTGALTKT